MTSQPISLHALVDKARNLKSEHGENPEYDRALVEIITDVTPPLPDLDYDQKRAVVERMIFREPRTFQISVTRTVSASVTFTEAEAHAWFPEADWGNIAASHAGNMEDEVAPGGAGIPTDLEARLMAELGRAVPDDDAPHIEEL